MNVLLKAIALVVALLATEARADPIPMFSGTGPPNPIQGIPATQPDFNALIGRINSSNQAAANRTGNYAIPGDYDPQCLGNSTTHDCSTALATAAAVTANGQNVNVYLQAGSYYTTNAVTLTGGQTLYCDGMGNTNILVDQAFSPSATGVVVLNSATSGDVATATSGVRDCTISFAQPSDQGTRANFASLGSCTSSLGGTGCKYPPGIYQPSTSSGRVAIQNVQFLAAWDSISLQHGGGAYINNIRDGSLDIGLQMVSTFDFGVINNWEHWVFGLSGNLLNLYGDGNDYAAQIDRVDGTIFSNFRTFEGRIALTSGFTWGAFNNLSLDGNNATLEVAATSSGAGGLQVHGGYSTGAATGANSHCQIDIASGNLLTTIEGFNFNAGGPGHGGLCVAGGQVNVTGGSFGGNGVTVLNLTGGITNVSGTLFRSPDRTFGSAQVVVGASAHVAITNSIQTTAATNGQAFGTFSSDFADNILSNNILNGWTFIPPGNLGVYYDNGAAFPETLWFQTAVPFYVSPTGSMANNGVATLGTALPATYANLYLHVPASAISAGSAAGWYYAQCTTGTACTLFNNTYTSGQPIYPASPTAFATTGPGAYTGETTEVVGPSYSLPANVMGNRDSLRITTRFSFSTSTNTKNLFTSVGGTHVWNETLSVADLTIAAPVLFSNRESQSAQVSCASVAGGCVGAAGQNYPTTSLNMANAQAIATSCQHTTATEYCGMDSFSVELIKSP